MEEDDNKHLYEVEREMAGYEGDGKDDFPHRPIANLQIHDTIPAGGKCSLYVLLAIQVVVILILIILLGINGVTLTHLNTVEMCNAGSTGASTGSLTSGSCATPNVSCNCSYGGNGIWAQLGWLVNMTRATIGKVDGIRSQVDGIVNYTTVDMAASKNLTSSIGQVGQTIGNQLGQMMNQMQDSSSKLDDLQMFATQQTTDTQNASARLDTVLQTTGDTASKLTTIVSTLNNIETTGVTTSSVANDILGIVDQLLELQNASSIFNSIRPVSCQDIKTAQPNSPTGHYHVNSRNIYCNMDTLCNVTGGWTRIGYMDMSDATQNCPSGFRYEARGSVRTCGRTNRNSASCSPSLTFPTNGLNYTKICGRVRGYQRGSTDAVSPGSQHNNINAWYIDGISITRGSPREHIWSFISGVFSIRSHGSNCPCTTGTNRNTQSFVGNNYYCESGNPNYGWSNSLYQNDPLWDGQQCIGLEAGCCTNPYLPWFYRDFGNVSSTEGLELRVCGDEGWGNEDTPFGLYEFYIQ